ncbi:MAG: hypothetical protein HQM10_03395 [Candidatus Riflebacteria bacterium]|nr:hypothetical protein [Candidatus Riflebacteria bacterium]
MKRLIPVLLAAALLMPVTSEAKAKKSKKAALVMGKEVIFVASDLRTASLEKDSVNNVKHSLVYYCPIENSHETAPGVDASGHALIPAFKHGDVWYPLSYDENGKIIVAGNPPVALDAAACPTPCGTEVCEPKKEKKCKVSKKGKKGKKGKKAKAPEATTEAAPEAKAPEAAADAAPAPAAETKAPEAAADAAPAAPAATEAATEAKTN